MASFRKKHYRSKNARKSRIKRLGKKSLIGGMMDEVFTKEKMVELANEAVKKVMQTMLAKANEEERAAAAAAAAAIEEVKAAEAKVAKTKKAAEEQTYEARKKAYLAAEKAVDDAVEEAGRWARTPEQQQQLQWLVGDANMAESALEDWESYWKEANAKVKAAEAAVATARARAAAAAARVEAARAVKVAVEVAVAAAVRVATREEARAAETGEGAMGAMGAWTGTAEGAAAMAAVEKNTSFTRNEVVNMVRTAVKQAVEAVATKAVEALPSSQWTEAMAAVVERVKAAALKAYAAEEVVDANNVAGGRRRYTRRWRRGRRM